jgi:hypothetical protein
MVSHWNPKKIGRLFGWVGFLKKKQNPNPKPQKTQHPAPNPDSKYQVFWI